MISGKSLIAGRLAANNKNLFYPVFLSLLPYKKPFLPFNKQVITKYVLIL
jgi:hypothetical protein